MNSSDCTIKEMFSQLGYIFEVPNYQRCYVWEVQEVDAYLKDIDYCYEQNQYTHQYDHFFGQMILRLTEENRASRQHFEIVDGQQRLTTFTLTIAACYRLILKKSTTMDDGTKAKALSVLKNIGEDYLISAPRSGSICRRLTLSIHDNPSLFAIANLIDVYDPKETFPQATYESQKRIYVAYSRIYSHLEKKFENFETTEYANNIKKFIDISADSLNVVVIKSTTLGYSYALYQIVNDRGVLLTPAELLKARTLELLSTNNALLSECEKIWDDILIDSGNSTKNYLIWHYMSILYKYPSKGKLHELYEKHILNCYGKRAISNDEQEDLANSIRLLHKSVIMCRSLSKGNIPIDGIHTQIQDMYYSLVVGLKNEYAIPVFLNILKVPTEELRTKIINFLTVLMAKFFFVAKTMGGMHPNSIASLYFEISKLISNTPTDYQLCTEKCHTKIIQKGSFDIFKAKIEHEIYSRQATTSSKYLLYFLELFYTSKKYTVSEILLRDNSMPVKFADISTEHIAARKLYDKDGIDLDQNERNYLGNLTLIGRELNNLLDDKKYEEKIPIYTVSPYIMTRTVASIASWKKEEFQKRQDKLVKKTIEIFNI